MIKEALREKIEPKMTDLIEEVRKSYGAKRCLPLCAGGPGELLRRSEGLDIR